MATCHNCHSELVETVESCFTCGWYIGPPNVREVKKEVERLALERRYENKITDLCETGDLEAIRGFEEGVKASCAVINMSIDFLYHFLSYKKAVYSTYGLSVEGQIRIPAKKEDASRRRSIDAMLFADYGEQIRFAALSLDGVGPKSYGPYSIKLREVTIGHRATLLEENSYSFVPKHGINSESGIPLGYRAAWDERHKLAVCKLAESIVSEKFDDLSKVLLSSNGDYATDDFIEVHIFGPFDANAIESVKGRTIAPDQKLEYAMLERIKELLKMAGKDWVEE